MTTSCNNHCIDCPFACHYEIEEIDSPGLVTGESVVYDNSMTNTEIPFPLGSGVTWYGGDGVQHYGFVCDLDSSPRYRWIQDSHFPNHPPFTAKVDDLLTSYND